MDNYDFPEDDIEFLQAWSSCAGSLGAYKHASDMLSSHASDFWIRDRQEVADALKAVMKQLERIAGDESHKLEAFIKESGKRRKNAR